MIARRAAAALLSAGLALASAAGSLYIEAKAKLAQLLLERAWSATADARDHRRPWPWADTWPVARLSVPRLGARWIVLAGASGRTLAFGPGHVDGTPLPGESGNAVVAGHRDTQFSALRHLRLGDDIEAETPDRRTVRYRVSELAVLDRDARGAPAAALGTQSEDTLTLVTCWPFDALLPGGAGRYLVRAVRVDRPLARPTTDDRPDAGRARAGHHAQHLRQAQVADGPRRSPGRAPGALPRPRNEEVPS